MPGLSEEEGDESNRQGQSLFQVAISFREPVGLNFRSGRPALKSCNLLLSTGCFRPRRAGLRHQIRPVKAPRYSYLRP